MASELRTYRVCVGSRETHTSCVVRDHAGAYLLKRTTTTTRTNELQDYRFVDGRTERVGEPRRADEVKVRETFTNRYGAAVHAERKRWAVSPSNPDGVVYYPVAYRDFASLKEAYKVYWACRRRAAALARWNGRSEARKGNRTEVVDAEGVASKKGSPRAVVSRGPRPDVHEAEVALANAHLFPGTFQLLRHPHRSPDTVPSLTGLMPPHAMFGVSAAARSVWAARERAAKAAKVKAAAEGAAAG